MSPPADARARGWRTLAALQTRIEDRIERALQREHGLSTNEYCALHHLSSPDGSSTRMQQLASMLVLSQSATTRLISRLEDRGLVRRVISPEDRRGIYAQATEPGRLLEKEAAPTHNSALEEALAEASDLPELTPLVQALESLSDLRV